MDHVSDRHYVKIWGILLALFVVSVCGPMLEIKIVTLITAFGIAIVKAYIVASEFMHLNIEKKYVSYILISMILLLFVFVAGAGVEVMGPKGSNWVKDPVPMHHEAPVHENSGH